jgi:hypothetical protein
MNEEENTLRTLKDERLLTTSRWCALGIHNWEKWSKPFKPMGESSSRYIQTRQCAHCNKMVVQEVKLPYWIAS